MQISDSNVNWSGHDRNCAWANQRLAKTSLAMARLAEVGAMALTKRTVKEELSKDKARRNDRHQKTKSKEQKGNKDVFTRSGRNMKVPRCH